MFCRVCGAKLKEGALFCGNCGGRVDAQDDATGGKASFEPIQTGEGQGSPSSQPASGAFEPIDPTERIGQAATTAYRRASDAVRSAQNAVTQQQRPAPQPAPQPAPIKRSVMQGYLSNNNLWTWLKKNERRQLFFTDNREQLTEDEYMGLLARRLAINDVPAQIERKYIRWDNSDVKTVMYVVNPSTTAVNPLSCILQFSNVGHFSFVEQKTFLTPPNLPPHPEDKVPVPTNNSMWLFIVGAACLLFGLTQCGTSSSYGYGYSGGGGVSGTAMMLGLIGVALLVIGYVMSSSKRNAIAHNNQCDEQLRAYNKAWQDWEDTVFLHSFQESTNGKITRIYQTVFESMKQLDAELFGDVESNEEREDTTMAQLRDQISSLKASYR